MKTVYTQEDKSRRINQSTIRIGIVTFAARNSIPPILNLIDIIHSLSQDLYLIITGNEGYESFRGDKRLYTYGIEHKSGSNVFERVVRYTYTQILISNKLRSLSKDIDLLIFFIGGDGLILPVLTGKLLRKKVVIAIAGSGLRVAKAQGDPFSKIIALLQNISYLLADKIVLYSEMLLEWQSLQRYSDKISIAREHFLDFEKFKIIRIFNERGDKLGYIGTLTKAKGVPNLLEAMPKVLAQKSEIEFQIGGSGQLRSKIEQHSIEPALSQKLKFWGWIPHEDLPKYLNDLKLLVLPSYTEGIPNIMLEAMACGTPVLATPVGAIPDIIKDGETGFIMENNSPECIASSVLRALMHPDLEGVAQRARALVEREFTFEEAVERWREVLEEAFP